MTASREMFSDELVEAMESLHLYPRLIAERAAKEAVANRNAEIAEAVRGRSWHSHTDMSYRDESQIFVSLADVLALVEP